jgi:hypothetical protein
MRQKEIERQLRRALRFPQAWFDTGLLTGELLRLQYRSLRKHYGNRSRPVRAPEHWRSGAFNYVLKRAKDEDTLVKLLVAAYADPDTLMGRAFVKDIRKHSLASTAVESSNNSLKSDVAKPRALG